MSPDGKRWAANIVDLIERECATIGSSEYASLAEAHDESGARVGAVIALWETEEPTPHVVIADLVTDPNARSGGVGKALVDFVLAEAKKRGIGWAFLESGLNNHRAHDFFEREGFEVVSKVFAKRL